MPDHAARPDDPPAGSAYALLVVAVLAAAGLGYAGYEWYPRFDMPAAEGIALLLLAAGAGVASFFSPCAFPLLVTLLARETAVADGGDARPPTARASVFAAALALGAAVFLLLTGIAIAAGGAVAFAGVTFTSVAGRTLRLITGIVLIYFGVVQLGRLPNPLRAASALSRPLLRYQARKRRANPVIGFSLFGFAYLLAGFG